MHSDFRIPNSVPLQVRQVSNWLSYGRSARLDTETSKCRRRAVRRREAARGSDRKQCGWASAQWSFIRSVCRVQHPDPLLTEMKVIRKSESGVRNELTSTLALLVPTSPFRIPTSKRPGTQIGKAVTLRAWRFCGFDAHLGHLKCGRGNAEQRIARHSDFPIPNSDFRKIP